MIKMPNKEVSNNTNYDSNKYNNNRSIIVNVN